MVILYSSDKILYNFTVILVYIGLREREAASPESTKS